MKSQIHYTVANGGDGSAYLFFCESEGVAQLYQELMDEPWGESCIGSIVIHHEGSIAIQEDLMSYKSIIDNEYDTSNYEKIESYLKNLLEDEKNKDGLDQIKPDELAKVKAALDYLDVKRKELESYD